MTSDVSGDTGGLRDQAVARLRKKRDFLVHAAAYVMVNVTLIVIWALTMPDGFFWPVFPMLGWGIGLVFHGIDTYAPAAPSEKKIRREMDRLAHR